MKLFLPPAVVALLGCAGVSSTAPNNSGAAPDLSEATRLFEAGEIDEALLLVDAILAADEDHRPARLLAANGSFKLFESRRSGAQFLLLEAIEHMKAALELDGDDGDSWLKLSGWQLMNSEFDAGIESGRRAYVAFEDKKASNDRKASALLAIADNQMQKFVDARTEELKEDSEAQAEPGTMASANLVLASAKSAYDLGAIGAATLRRARVMQWLQRPAQALKELERGIVAAPTDGDLHTEFRNLYLQNGDARACVGAYKRILKTHGENPVLLWYLGRAQAAAADKLRRNSSLDAAKRLYEDARESYESCKERRPAFAESCDQWRAICELSLGRIEFDSGDRDAAVEHYEQAYANHAGVAEYVDGRPKLYDAFGKHYLGNLFLVGEELVGGSEGPGLEDALAFWDRLIDRHPDQFGAVYNNAALSARDLGAHIEQSATGDERRAAVERAMQLFEKSYRYYEKAVELEPNDARIANDCGLMLVYHLHRDYDRARALFDRAIELGEAQLAELPEDTTESQRNNAEEAVGDAYQNIGRLLEQLDRPASEVRTYYERAVEFYPTQKREAARRLERLGDAKNASFSPAPQQDPRKKSFDERIKAAEAHAKEQDFDSALLVMDKMAKDMKDYAPFHYHFGLYSLRYAQASAGTGGNAGLIAGLFQDAVAQLKRSVELDGKSTAARLRLGDACTATGAFAEAREAVAPLTARKDLSAEDLAAAHLIHAVAAARQYIAAKQGGGDEDKAALTAARKSFEAAEKAGTLAANQRSVWVNLEEWAGAGDRATKIMARALKQTPGDQMLLAKLVEVGQRTGDTANVAKLLASRRDALGVWYHGKALFNDGQAKWNGSNAKDAVTVLNKAVKEFDRAKQLNAAYADSCNQWAAICIATRGNVHLSQDALEPAEASFLEALERHPGTLATQLNGGSIKRGILVVGDKHYRGRNLGKVADLYIAAGKLVPDDVDFANNEGLFARDHGVQVVRRENEKKAKPYFEASYAAYTRAGRLDPTNVRLRNDRALLLIYHLHREFDTAHTLLDEAIRDGLAQLEDSPPEDAGELRNLQEAVGDCYENLGFYFIEHNRNLAKARAALERSIEFYPFERRRSTAHLRRVARLEKEKKDK